LNDPRNPDCPCHKYQKQAEDEYRKYLKEEEKKTAEKKSLIEKKDNLMKENFSARHKRKGIFFRKHKIGGRKHGREKKQRKSWLCTMF
jgi:hypothetical protein